MKSNEMQPKPITILNNWHKGALVILIALLPSVGANYLQAVTRHDPAPPVVKETALTPPISVDNEYAYFSFDDMINEANIVVAGTVQTIGPTRWNQDSGTYWEYLLLHGEYETTISATPYYEITLTVEQWLVGEAQTADTLTITVPDMRPTGQAATLREGDEIVAFVRQSDIGWFEGEITYNVARGTVEMGEKEVLLFLGAPETAALPRDANGRYVHWDGLLETATPYTLEQLREWLAARP